MAVYLYALQPENPYKKHCWQRRLCAGADGEKHGGRRAGSGLYKSRRQRGRTKAVLNPAAASDKALIQAAWNDYNAVSEEIMSAGKYDNPTTQVDDMRTIFKFKPLEMARKANSKALEYEDMVFSRSAYAESLAGYLKANGVTAEEYLNAVQEAQPAANNKTASVGETESTAVNTNPNEHTPAEQAVIEEYQNAVDERIVSFVEKWNLLTNADYKKKTKLPIAEVSERAINDIHSLLGTDISGYKHVLNGGALAHIIKRHGKTGKADKTMADINDIARMGYVLNNYDSVEAITNADGSTKKSTEYSNSDNTMAPLVQFQKKINGTYYIVEAVPNSAAHQMRIISAYMSNKKESTDQVLNIPQSGPQSTSKTPLGANALLINTSVPQNGTGVNNKDNTPAAQNPSNGGEINGLIDRARLMPLKRRKRRHTATITLFLTGFPNGAGQKKEMERLQRQKMLPQKVQCHSRERRQTFWCAVWNIPRLAFPRHIRRGDEGEKR